MHTLMLSHTSPAPSRGVPVQKMTASFWIFRRRAMLTAPAMIATLGLAGCAQHSPFEPLRPVVGQYRPTLWTATSGATTTDVLAAGGQLPLALTAQGDVIARVIVPATVAGVDSTDTYVPGTFTLTGRVVHIRSDVDTFVRDMPLTVTGNTLVGDQTFGAVRVQITFTKLSSQ